MRAKLSDSLTEHDYSIKTDENMPVTTAKKMNASAPPVVKRALGDKTNRNTPPTPTLSNGTLIKGEERAGQFKVTPICNNVVTFDQDGTIIVEDRQAAQVRSLKDALKECLQENKQGEMSELREFKMLYLASLVDQGMLQDRAVECEDS